MDGVFASRCLCMPCCCSKGFMINRADGWAAQILKLLSLDQEFT